MPRCERGRSPGSWSSTGSPSAAPWTSRAKANEADAATSEGLRCFRHRARLQPRRASLSMKKAILVMLAVLAASGWTPIAHAENELTYNVLLAGGAEANEIHIWLTPDGRTYVIESI